MSPFGWIVALFAIFMAGVSLFTFVQIERNKHHHNGSK